MYLSKRYGSLATSMIAESIRVKVTADRDAWDPAGSTGGRAAADETL